jgi:putative PEP-CTERM system histidine kinase
VTAFSLLPLAAAVFSAVLAVASLLRRKPTTATWCFFAGMVALALDSLLAGLALRVSDPSALPGWLTAGFIVESIVPGIWLAFSLAYSRGNYRDSFRRWKLALLAIGVLPFALSVGFRDQLFQIVPAGEASDLRLQSGQVAQLINMLLVVALMFVLINVEQTFRSAVGTMRWRIKFVVLALVMIFGARLYVRTEAILYSAPDIMHWGIESGGLMLGCVFLAVAYARTGLAEIDVYPSLAVLRSSITVLFVGGYLFIVGVLAQVVRRFGGAESFQLQAFAVLVGMAGLAVLLLSDRARQRLQLFVGRHFRKAQHDSVQTWTAFSQQLASVTDQRALASVSARLISETFDALSITVWVEDEETGRLELAASTAPRTAATNGAPDSRSASAALAAALNTRRSPFDLESIDDTWADELRRLNPSAFPNGGNRWCVPLRTTERVVGALVLADRVSGAQYTEEDLELLQCIADQITSVLLNLRLASQVARAREMEAFQTMAAFFVHDLKNAAASLELMLQNLPVHFEDPAFRADALRGIGNTARRIEDMIARLGAFRQRPAPRREKTDLNRLIEQVLATVELAPPAELSPELQIVPPIVADREQIHSVITNLVINAREALDGGGTIRVRTEHQGGRVLLSVIDSGRGMSPEFLKDRLFRPFQSTKKKGLGIGLFQCRAIVQAHGGGIHAVSRPGRGTTFTVSFPASEAESRPDPSAVNAPSEDE